MYLESWHVVVSTRRRRRELAHRTLASRVSGRSGRQGRGGVPMAHAHRRAITVRRGGDESDAAESVWTPSAGKAANSGPPGGMPGGAAGTPGDREVGVTIPTRSACAKCLSRPAIGRQSPRCLSIPTASTSLHSSSILKTAHTADRLTVPTRSATALCLAPADQPSTNRVLTPDASCATRE
jgi:hypothetical protein